jgi:hypothetical protein
MGFLANEMGWGENALCQQAPRSVTVGSGGVLATVTEPRRLPPGAAQSPLGLHQSHQRSRSSTPRAMSPSCTCEVPSTIVSCFASR